MQKILFLLNFIVWTKSLERCFSSFAFLYYRCFANFAQFISHWTIILLELCFLRERQELLRCWLFGISLPMHECPWERIATTNELGKFWFRVMVVAMCIAQDIGWRRLLTCRIYFYFRHGCIHHTLSLLRHLRKGPTSTKCYKQT